MAAGHGHTLNFVCVVVQQQETDRHSHALSP